MLVIVALHILRSDLFIAPESEIQAEAQALCLTRGIIYQPYSRDLTYLLSPMEQHYKFHYELKWFTRYGRLAVNDPNIVFGFNDNPLNRVSRSANGRLPTLRTNSDKIFIPSLRRFMTLRERLAAMGFPVYPSLARASQSPLVERVTSHMLGNAVFLPNVMTVAATCLACTRRY